MGRPSRAYLPAIGVACIAGLGVAGLTLAGQQPSAPAAGSIKVVASVTDIMRAMTTPTSEVVFAAGADPPTTDDGWENLRLNAAALAESANLLMLGARVRDREDWLTMARAQLDAAEEVARLAALRRADGLEAASDRTYDTCTNCHNKYWSERNKAE